MVEFILNRLQKNKLLLEEDSRTQISLTAAFVLAQTQKYQFFKDAFATSPPLRDSPARH